MNLGALGGLASLDSNGAPPRPLNVKGAPPAGAPAS
jgi:hypothetical protein